MAPKKDKKSEPDENQWETIIVEAPLDDDNWKVKVVLIETVGGEQERMYLNKFEIFAAEEKRFVIKNICKTETIFMINQLGGDKKIKDPNLKVFEECQSYLADKKDIPPDVLALVIKHLILKMKDEYLFISQQRLEVRQGMQRESATMVNKAEVRGTVGSATQDEPPPPPPPPVKGKGKGDGEPASVVESSEGKKFNTQLRVRGEEWRDKVYVDDYPIDGPNLYVAVTGFMEPNLPGSLVKVGIPLTAVVQIKIDPTQIKVPSGLMKATKRGQSLTELLVEKSLKFWDDIQQLRIDENSADDFKDTAFIVFSPPYWNSDDLSGSPEKIYDELCFLMYDIQDLSRQHLHYKDNMSIMDVPEDVCNQHFNKLYDQNIDDLPLECVTIYSVLDSILRIACTSGEEEGEISETSVQSAEPSVIVKNTVEEKKMEISENLVKQIFNTLCNTEAGKKKYRLTYGQEYEDNREPIVIHYGDLAKYNTFHLGNINLDNIVLTSLLGMPINNLWRTQPRPCGELEAKINFHVNVLLSCFERSDVETAELNRLLNILACRKLYNNRSSLKKLHLSPTTISEFKKKYLKRSVLAEPLPQSPSFAASGILSSSFPSMTRSDNDYECAFSQPNLDPESQRLNFLFDCPDISQLVTAAEIENNKPLSYNLIDDFDYFEDLSGNCAHQILRDAFNKFNCVDYKYCEVTDSFILMCFNSHDNEGISREEWRSHLTTPLCLQDFFDFILDEEYDWIQNEEKIYDENLLMEARSVSKDVVDPHALKSCVETTDVEMDLLMEGSLKYEEYVQVEEAVTETTDISESVTTKLPMSVDVDSKSTKKKAASARKPTKFHKESEITNIEVESLEIPAKPFLGYDLGDRRVEVFGKDAIFFSRDGTKITSMYTLTIPINLEYINLNILPGNGNNEFWMHKALGDYVTQEIRDTCESFRITSKDQVLIYVKKQMYKVSLPSSSTPDVHTARSVNKTNALDEDGSKIEETKYFHSLYVTWPNGMITETVYQDNSPKLSHIKQYHTRPMPHLDEEMRCISLNGEVIIFKPSNDIEVFKPDGTYIKINKYYKRAVPVIAQEPEVEPREEIAKKAKKSKSKGSSKIVEPVEEIVELPPAEYEVIVNEFEIIEPNGLRQQWVDEDPIDLEKLLIKTATDYCLGEVFSRRMDGTNILLNKDGLQCVTFPDKTRIVTSYVVDDLEIYPEWTDEEIELFLLYEPDTIEGPISKSSVSQKSNLSSTSASKKMEEEEVVKANERTDGYVFIHILYTVEHPNFSTVSINNVNGTISVESPNETVVTVDKENNYEMNLDNETSASFDGENLLISYEACSECRAFTNCDIKIMSNGESSLNAERIWLKMTDSFNTQIVVDDEGAIGLSDEPNMLDPLHAETVSEVEYGAKHNSEAEDKDPDIKSESSLVSHGKCREMYLAKNVRFFVVRRDFNCAELLHRALVEEYKRACRWKPWCSINQFDTFGDHRNLVSILTPIHLTESEKWLMESKQANKPKFLTYKDLKKDDGKGFYHWMRPYERFVPQPLKPDNVLPERLPRAYILRILEREWDDEKRKELKGARELIQAVLRYRCIMEADRETIVNIPLIDMRNDEERRVDDVIQALAHRIYEDLKGRVADDIQSRAKLTITTSPLVVPEEVSVEGEYEEETDEAKSLEERRESLVEEAEAAEKISPALQRYWRRRAEEFKEEQFYKYLLREGSVPPYFRNVLGGAIWWEVNNATAEAVTLAERRNMKCVCADHEATSSGSAPTSKRYM